MKNEEKSLKNLPKGYAFLEQNERIEDLQCEGLKIIQNPSLYTFTSDSVILANFVKTKSLDKVVEIGTGCGVISILVQAKNKLKKITAFEIQKAMFKLAQKNIEMNGVDEKIDLICDDIENFDKYIKKHETNVIFCNPPYFKETNFPQTEVNKIAKEELFLSCEKLCSIVSELLAEGGTFFVCYPAERSAELISTLQKYNLATKEMFFTENGKGKVKTLFLKATKNGKFGTKVYPNLVTNGEEGDYLGFLHTKNFLS